MNLIERHIEYLMIDHDCVIVPGLGAFLAHHYEASYDMDNELFSSPGRRYAFNGELSSADGLLTMSVARAMGTDSREAAHRIEACVADMRRELDINGTVAIGHIGHLVKGEDGMVTFEPSPRDLVTPLVNWMPEVGVAPLGSLRRQREIALAENVETVRPRRFARFVRTSLGAAAAILVAIVVSTPVAVKDTYKASTALPPVKIVNVTVPEVTAATQTTAVNTDTDDIIEPKAENTVIEPKADNVIGETEKVTTHIQPIANKQASTNSTEIKQTATESTQTKSTAQTPVENAATPLRFDELDDYIVVVASLANAHEVDKFLEQQRRVNKNTYFGVIQSGRYHRVYVATGGTKEQALKQARLPQVRDRFKDAWVTRR